MITRFQCSPQQWDRVSKPLELIDESLIKFANLKSLPLARNTRDVPNREFRWIYHIERIIEIYLDCEQDISWTLEIAAYDYANSIRLRKKQVILQSVSINVLEIKLDDALDIAYETVCTWKKSNLTEVDL